MAKLAAQDRFLDLSDYGRPLATIFANQLKNTRFTPIHVTLLFGISGLIAVYCILHNYYFLASIFIVLKSVIDAADGELSRVKNTPSYTGRYLDSVFDIMLNFMFLMSICAVSNSTFWGTFVAFLSVQLQGTLYNYYYVILRNNSVGGDATSKIFERNSPVAFPYESQTSVNILFRLYLVLYGIFDRIIYGLDKEASQVKALPNWFMTCLSIYGLGFQLLIISAMLALQLTDFIIPFFIGYNLFIVVLVGIRRFYLK